MAVKFTKPEINVREKLAELDKPSGIAGEAMLRADTVAEQQAMIGAGRKNLIINGDFRVSQRGDYTSATSATHNQLYLDRWTVRLTNVTANILHILGTNSAPGYPYKDSNSLRLTATNSATGVMRHLQRVEGFLSGRTLTISAWVKSNSPNARVFSYQHNGGTRVSSKPHSGNGQWEYLTLTTINDANAANQLYFDIALATETFTNIAITSGEYVEISEVQMEVGNVATPFEYRLYGEELALCQRYYYKTDIIRYLNLGRYNNNTGSGLAWWNHPVYMRAAATMSSSGTWNTNTGYSGALSYAGISQDGCQLSSSVNIAANQMVYAHGARIIGDAEL
jgi:hypothetical protein